MSSPDPAFLRALVATLYVLDVRGDALAEVVGEGAPRALLAALASPERATRAAALAAELGRIVVALDAGALA